MSYFRPGASTTVPVAFAGACGPQWSITSCPFTHNLAPSSLYVPNVYTPPSTACTDPAHLTENVSPLIFLIGEPVPQSKFTTRSTRSTRGPGGELRLGN